MADSTQWSDLVNSWEHPINNIVNGAKATWSALFTGDISSADPSTVSPSSADLTGSAEGLTVDTPDSTGLEGVDWSAWGIGLGAIVVLLLVVLLLHELESF